MVTMKVVKEKLIIGVLGLLLAGSFAALFLEYEAAVALARGICVVLTVLFLVGIWFPARRYVKRAAQKAANDTARSNEGDDSP